MFQVQEVQLVVVVEAGVEDPGKIKIAIFLFARIHICELDTYSL
jgi:hypothetical protein